MELVSKVSFRGVEPSEAVEARVRDRVARLPRLHDRIERCEVVVEAPHHHKHKGELYCVRIRMHVPGQALIIDHAGPKDQAHEDVYIAVRDAFDAAERRLEGLSRRKQEHA